MKCVNILAWGLVVLLGAVDGGWCASPYIELGPSDNIAVDQPRVTVQVLSDSAGTTILGPNFPNDTFLLDTGSTGILAVGGAVNNLVSNGYATEGTTLEQGIGGTCTVGVSAQYRFDFAGLDGIRQTVNNSRILSDADTPNFGSFGGIVGMPGLIAAGVTSLDFTVWKDGPDLMKVSFSDTLPDDNGHRYSVTLNPVTFPITGEEPHPTSAPLPFMNAFLRHNGVERSGNAVADTGAQISLISEAMAFAIGLDANGNGDLSDEAIGFIPVGGLCGEADPSPLLMEVDEIHLPTNQGIDLVWTDLQLVVLDIPIDPQLPSIDIVFGSDLLTSGWFLPAFGLGGEGFIDQAHFDFRNFPGGPGTLYLDLNAAVDNVVPEPSTLVLAALAMLGFFFYAWRCRVVPPTRFPLGRG